MSLNEESITAPDPGEDLDNQLAEEEEEVTQNAMMDGKQKLSDTFMTFLPKNTSSGISKEQIVDIQIPRSEWVLYLNKAYIYVDLVINASIAAVQGNSENYIGLMNSACIFDQISINNGRTLFTDTFCQVNSRFWQLSKSDNYLHGNPASFINHAEPSMNEGFLLIPVNRLHVMGNQNEYHLRMRIPLPCLFNCFDNCKAFSTTQLNENVTLSLHLSKLEKYMCLFECNGDKVVHVKPINVNNTIISDGQVVTLYDREDSYHIYDIKLVVPCHYPNETEKVNFDQQIKNGLVVCNYRTCEIQSQIVNLGANAGASTVGTNFSTSVRNMFGIFIACSHNHNYTVFDKPNINNIECNLSEVTKLANGKVHVDGTYGGGANDMYMDLMNYFGGDAYKEFNRFEDSILNDYFSEDPNLTLGSYIQFYKIAAGEQIGFDADYFANIINFKCKVGDPAFNFDDSNVFCGQHAFKQLIYVDGAIDVVTPFRDNLNYKAMLEDNNVEHGVGAATLITTGLGALGKMGGGLIGRIRASVLQSRSHKNDLYAYSTLGKDLYEKHKDILSRNLTSKKRRFKKFVNSLKAAEGSAHGLLVKHGALATGASATGSDLPNDNIQGEEANSYELMNLKALYRPSPRVTALEKDFKMRVPLDYKLGLNKGKLYMTSFGRENSLHNIQHGFRDWLHRKWDAFKNWFKPKASEAGSNLLSNLSSVARQYVNDIITGKLKLKDVPRKFRGQVMSMLKNKSFTGTRLDPAISTAIDYATNIRHGIITLDKVPKAYKSGVDTLLKNDPYFKPGSDEGSLAPTAEQRNRMRKLLRRKRAYYNLSRRYPGMPAFNPNASPFSLLSKDNQKKERARLLEQIRNANRVTGAIVQLPPYMRRYTSDPSRGIWMKGGRSLMKARTNRLLHKYEKAKSHGMILKPKQMRKLAYSKFALMNPRLFKETNFRLVN